MGHPLLIGTQDMSPELCELSEFIVIGAVDCPTMSSNEKQMCKVNDIKFNFRVSRYLSMKYIVYQDLLKKFYIQQWKITR